jgi:hypothetical protein
MRGRSGIRDGEGAAVGDHQVGMGEPALARLAHHSLYGPYDQIRHR